MEGNINDVNGNNNQTNAGNGNTINALNNISSQIAMLRESNISSNNGLREDFKDLNNKFDALKTNLETKISIVEERVQKIGRKTKCNKFWECLCSHWFLWMIILFFILGITMFLTFYPITDDKQVSVVLAFVGILATFVVVSNYAQVRDVKQETDKQVQAVKQETDKQVQAVKQETDRRIQEAEQEFNKKIHDSQFISEATRLRDKGNRYRDNKDYISSLRCYIRALNYTNKLYEKIEIDGIVSEIEWLLLTHIDEITISSKECDAFIKVIENSNYSSSLVESIKKISISDNSQTEGQ